MKIKLDENLPVELGPIISALGHDVDTVPGEQLSGEPDPVIWNAAQSAARFLITQDLDFSDVRSSRPAHTPASCSFDSGWRRAAR